MKEADKNTLIELCGQIKAKLQHKNKIYHVLMIDANNEDFSDVYDDMIDELYEKWCDNGIETESRIICYDCGGYDRSLHLYGVKIENDELLFYLTEIEMTYDGDNEVEQYKLTLDELLNPKTWWMSGGNPTIPFRLDEVLEYYIKDIV